MSPTTPNLYHGASLHVSLMQRQLGRTESREIAERVFLVVRTRSECFYPTCLLIDSFLFFARLFCCCHGMMNHRLAQCLPSSGESIEAQSHDNVTMLFSDLVGFTAICATATPMEIISLLQSLYTQFDVLCGDLDIYKVVMTGNDPISLSSE